MTDLQLRGPVSRALASRGVSAKIADTFTLITYAPARLLVLTGEVDVAAALSLGDALDGLVEQLPEETDDNGAPGRLADPVRIRVDLHDVTFIDLAGIRPLLRTARTLRRRHGRLQLVAWSPGVVRVLNVLNFVETRHHRFGSESYGAGSAR